MLDRIVMKGETTWYWYWNYSTPLLVGCFEGSSWISYQWQRRTTIARSHWSWMEINAFQRENKILENYLVFFFKPKTVQNFICVSIQSLIQMTNRYFVVLLFIFRSNKGKKKMLSSRMPCMEFIVLGYYVISTGEAPNIFYSGSPFENSWSHIFPKKNLVVLIVLTRHFWTWNNNQHV